MEPVLRAIGCYLLLLFVVRLSGKRGLAQVTIFDLVLLLLISQTVGQALIGDDSSLTTAAIITITLIVINRANDTVAHRWADMSHVLEDAPLVLIENGKIREIKEYCDSALIERVLGPFPAERKLAVAV